MDSNSFFSRSIVSELKTKDRVRYYTTLFLPEEHHSFIALLQLLQHEISSIFLKTQESSLALIRLHWWEEQITFIMQGKTASSMPLLQSLHHSPEKEALSQLPWQKWFAANHTFCSGASACDIDWQATLKTCFMLPYVALAQRAPLLNKETIETLSFLDGALFLLEQRFALLTNQMILIPDLLRTKFQTFLDRNTKATALEFYQLYEPLILEKTTSLTHAIHQHPSLFRYLVLAKIAEFKLASFKTYSESFTKNRPIGFSPQEDFLMYLKLLLQHLYYQFRN